MKNLLLIISIFCCSFCFGQLPSSGKYCIDVVKSDNGKYYALYSDNTWKESTQATADVFKAVTNQVPPSTKITTNVNNYEITSPSPTKSTSPYTSRSSNSRYYKSEGTSNRRTTTSRTYIQGPRGGCYYINSRGNKTYVARSMCD